MNYLRDRNGAETTRRQIEKAGSPSRDARYVTGATFVIDGGLTLNQGQGA